jgi:hypothetical protein
MMDMTSAKLAIVERVTPNGTVIEKPNVVSGRGDDKSRPLCFGNGEMETALVIFKGIEARSENEGKRGTESSKRSESTGVQKSEA